VVEVPVELGDAVVGDAGLARHPRMLVPLVLGMVLQRG
jgi:hypothetical protein